MSAEDILDPDYWRNRLLSARERHTAIFRCPKDRWERIAKKHKKILEGAIKPDDAILDAGCGWGRILDLMPAHWHGYYYGVDLCPDFIRIARDEHPNHTFHCADLSKELLNRGVTFNLAICVSFRPMIKRNIGPTMWDIIERNIRSVASNILYLEYDENAEGSFE